VRIEQRVRKARDGGWESLDLFYSDLRDEEFERILRELLDGGGAERLTWLNLGSNQLTRLPPDVRRLKRVTMLSLEGNPLGAVPPEAFGLAELSVLDLCGTGLTSLPAEVGGLARLEELNLNGNALTDLPPELARLSELAGCMSARTN
jgi:Leucine-rich repeat (LRR) protein